MSKQNISQKDNIKYRSDNTYLCDPSDEYLLQGAKVFHTYQINFWLPSFLKTRPKQNKIIAFDLQYYLHVFHT